MTIAIITEAGVRKVAPLVVVAQQAAAIATQMAGIASAIASERYYASYAAGNAATTAGQYFAVLASGVYDFYLHGTGTPVVKLPTLDVATGKLLLTTDAAFGGTTAPANTAGYQGQVQVNGLYPCVTLNGTTGNRKWSWGVSATGLLELWDNNASATRLSVDLSGNILFGGDGTQDLGSGSHRGDTAFFITGSINTSDERDKEDIEPIPDTWLDAWAGVEWVRYKFIGKTRWHAGLIAQQVHAAFAAHDIDAFEIGLCCFDEWDAEPARLDEDGGVIVPAREAGSRWGLRYSECEAMEAAYQRREIALLKAQVAAL